MLHKIEFNGVCNKVKLCVLFMRASNSCSSTKNQVIARKLSDIIMMNDLTRPLCACKGMV